MQDLYASPYFDADDGQRQSTKYPDDCDEVPTPVLLQELRWHVGYVHLVGHMRLVWKHNNALFTRTTGSS